MRIREATEADLGAIAHVQLDSWRSAYAGIMPDHYLAEFTFEDREADWREQWADASTHLLYVAETPEGEIVGFALAYPLSAEDAAETGYAGELSSLHIRRAYHRQEIGRHLFAAVVERLRQAGVPSLWLWVLAANPARGFYERFGGQRVGDRTIDPGDVEVAEVAYGWPDINTLAAALAD
jgi:ribosomal protein S18 acetylase RimI-like enzyme